jgi:hypothetical protein
MMRKGDFMYFDIVITRNNYEISNYTEITNFRKNVTNQGLKRKSFF